MSEVKIKENETLESALRRFKRKTAMAGVMSEIRKREHYEKPRDRKSTRLNSSHSDRSRMPSSA